MVNSKIDRIKELVNILNEAAKAYYSESREIMTNYEYDALYDELTKLEEETGIVLANSPTNRVGYEVLSELPKETHASPMLSLSKTKSREELADWLKDKEGLLSWKMDGLTIVLTYNDGKLVKAVTRGNGEVGEVITNNARVFTNVPLNIPYKGELILRGEAVISYSDFEKINREIEDDDAKYKNPRNLCSGSIRQLDSKIAAERGIRFIAWKCINGIDDNDFINRLFALRDYGFEIVPFFPVPKNPTEEQVQDIINELKEEANRNGFPIDGIVFGYRDVAYGESLGMTSHHLNSQIAFKFKNDVEYTTLNGIQWQVGRTGQIVPVGILETINILDTDVSKVSLHNLKVLEDLNIKVGATVGIVVGTEVATTVGVTVGITTGLKNTISFILSSLEISYFML